MPIRSLCVKTLTAGFLMPLALTGCRSSGTEGYHHSRIYLPHVRLPWVPRESEVIGSPELAHPPVTSMPPGTSWHYSQPYPEHQLPPAAPPLAEPELPPPPMHDGAPPAPPSEFAPPPELPGPAFDNTAPPEDELLEEDYQASRVDPRRYGRLAVEARRSPTTHSPEAPAPSASANSPRMFDSIGANVRGMFDAVRNRLPGGSPEVAETKPEPEPESSDELTDQNRESIARMFEENGRPAIARQFRAGVQNAETSQSQPHVSAQRPTLIPPQRDTAIEAPVTPASQTTSDRTGTFEISSPFTGPLGGDEASFWGHTVRPGMTPPAVGPAQSQAEAIVPVATRSVAEESLPPWPHAPREQTSSSGMVAAQPAETPAPILHREVSATRFASKPVVVEEPVEQPAQTTRTWSPAPPIVITPGPKLYHP